MPAARIWTIGHSTRSYDEFLALLRANGIQRVADIRTIPQSRRHPQFGRGPLGECLGREGIAYRHFPALGGLRKPGNDSPNGAWKNQSFRGYADHMLTPEFADGLDALLEFSGTERAAVMCAEAVWWRCHRMLLADALLGRGVEVRHILSEASPMPHRPTPFGRFEADGRVVYPGLI